jgi:hypothetical protein
VQFFQRFPTVEYQTTEVVDGVIRPVRRTIPNMTVRFVSNIFDDENLAYFTYRVKDLDRPDTVAAQFYGAARYAWVVCLVNNIHDLYDWPMGDYEFTQYLDRKYESSEGSRDGVAVASATVAEYRWNKSDGQVLVVDQTAYNALAVDERSTRTLYDVEYDLNDERRLLRLPTTESLPSLVRQFEAAVSR